MSSFDFGFDFGKYRTLDGRPRIFFIVDSEDYSFSKESIKEKVLEMDIEALRMAFNIFFGREFDGLGLA